VSVDGISVLDQPREAHRKLGYLSDFFGLYDELTVRQCLLHAASIRAVATSSSTRSRQCEQTPAVGFEKCSPG